MIIPTWKKVHRKRSNMSYLSPNYVKYYDLDTEDFQNLVQKVSEGTRLTDAENDRYGTYILTISIIVMEGPKFKKKPVTEKEEMIEQQYYELLTGLPTFDPEKGKIYSYAYRIAYVAAVHYYTEKTQEEMEQNAIVEHCERELLDYYDECLTHKTPRR